MFIEYAETARMSQTGSSLLRAIQNNSTPVLDLLIRESIQNSLDASDGETPYVRVDFNTGKFSSLELATQLEGITDKLWERYPEKQSFISIKDRHTNGLSGPMSYDEVVDNEYGNLIKLVYEINKPQNKEGAGGSWGLGKTVYYRVGIGLVIFYSRVKLINGQYQSRLAACLVEDEKKRDALLKRPGKNIERGIAWWGIHKAMGSRETQPVTDIREIRRMLAIFGLKEYTGDETGTMVIIPYISDQNLLKETYHQPIEGNEHLTRPFWTHHVDEYLHMSVQKWYHPRISNEEYKYGKYLRVLINGQEVSIENFYPYFSIMQNLYNCAVNNRESIASLPDIKVNLKKVELRNIFSEGGHAGTMAHIEVNDAHLGMLPPNNLPSPYEFISQVNEDANHNPLIMGYTRKTGMIVSYEIMGPWTDNTPKSEPGKYILSFFVLNSKNKLKVGKKPISLEEYIRQGEQADHTSWGDWTLSSGNPFIVGKIQAHLRNSLTNTYKKVEELKNFVEDKGMGREFAKFLLPPTGYGKGSSPRKKGVAKSTVKDNKTQLVIGDSPVFEEGKVIFDFIMNISELKNPMNICLKAVTEQMGLKADDWEKEDNIGTEFPLSVQKVKVEWLKINNQEISYPANIDVHNNHNLSPVQVDFLATKRFRQQYGISIFSNDDSQGKKSLRMKGKIICKIHDAQTKVGIDLMEDTNGK